MRRTAPASGIDNGAPAFHSAGMRGVTAVVLSLGVALAAVACGWKRSDPPPTSPELSRPPPIDLGKLEMHDRVVEITGGGEGIVLTTKDSDGNILARKAGFDSGEPAQRRELDARLRARADPTVNT